ncbi:MULTISPECIES: thioredoxin-dependent thiol peroxidase [unclassified Corallococcus]|uniref:thioredoxin-dependent thiol peroxidase n=1 Tax=unclassified Corallococcus TaxID=2685029 RepID=UPI001A8EDE0F|nr:MULTISPECIES: thioredoxin-dependent thiol peroxidase [unclassified Corallococcus]MBN9682306.1 thioredoxin-dependent thiol peroxidase [Corallococcus sp. NCSPR001]WAS86138.1 thioredoxin-dependent thiol peroxidase [Corallococcus sp. NCRR]
MPMPQAGDKAPGFSLPDQSGATVSLSQFKGRHVVLYFYPKDATPGCTTEACDFRDEHSALVKAGAVVLGVSPDSVASHQKFATKQGLPFSLLADPDHALADAYGVWGEKSLYGRKFMGLIRATFLIGPDAKVVRVWPKVKVAGHVAEVLATLQGGASSAAAPAPQKAPAKAPAKKASAAEAKPATVKKPAAKKAPAAKGAARKGARA